MKKKYFLYAVAAVWLWVGLTFLPVFGGMTPDWWMWAVPITLLLLAGWIYYKAKGLD